MGISVCNQVSNENAYKGEPGQGKNCSHCSFQDFHSLTKRNQVSLVRMQLSHPESDGKSDFGGGGQIGILRIRTEKPMTARDGHDPQKSYGLYFSPVRSEKLGLIFRSLAIASG